MKAATDKRGLPQMIAGSITRLKFCFLDPRLFVSICGWFLNHGE